MLQQGYGTGNEEENRFTSGINIFMMAARVSMISSMVTVAFDKW
jgi:hypothetical protein